MADDRNQVNLLLVDDKNDNLTALELTLQDLGQKMIKVNSGDDALRHLLKDEFAVIIMDVEMPGMDGFETAKLVRQHKRCARTPIIFLTAKYVEDQYWTKAYALGAVDYMIKPINGDILRSKVSVFVDLYNKTEEVKRQSELINTIRQKEYEARLAAETQRMEAENYRVKQELLKQEMERKILEERSVQLQESSRLKSEFLANMSHEIRTPMNAVVGLTELLLHTPLNNEQRDFANMIRESSQVLLSIINDILDFSKIEAGKLDLQVTEFELASVVEGVANLLSREAVSKELSLIAFVDPALPHMVRGDSMRIRQILLNLMNNAIKFTDKGEINLRAMPAKNSGLDGKDIVTVHFSVKDTGIGLSRPEVDRLFQPFTQGDGSTTRKYGGTGLGLSISKRLVELMNGQIGLESRKGKGSKFWFTLPLEIAQQEDSNIVRADMRRLKALVVDDQPSWQRLLRTYLASWGMKCSTADNAQTALTALKQAQTIGEPFDLAIVDLVMPDMDGFAMAETFYKDPSHADTKLILLTGYDEKGKGELAVRSGFSAYLTKPVKQSHLYDCIVKVMDLNDETAVVQAPEVEKVREPNADHKAKMILVAEDNPVNEKVTRLQLKELGFDCVVVANGRLAAKEALKGDYSLVLMDCHMPEMDGFAATSIVRKGEALTGRHIPIIGLTAEAMTGHRAKCISAGMDDYLSKPVALDRLEQTIHKWLSEDSLVVSNVSNGDTKSGVQAARSADSVDSQFGAQLIETFGEEEALAVLKIYLSSTKGLLEKLETAIFEQKVDVAGKLAHELKGASASVGAVTLASLSLKLEQAIKKEESDWREAAGLFDEITMNFDRIRIDAETVLHVV